MASKKEVILQSNKKKDKWDKASVILSPLGGLLAALTVAGVGYFGSSYLDDRQDSETRIRLYTELISKREEAESALRKDMFNSIIGTFLEPKSTKLEDKVLQLELLAFNFHESFNLMPLFSHLSRQVEQEDITEAAKKSYLERLQKVATEITAKQVAVLEGAGDKHDIEIDLTDKGNLILQATDLKSDSVEIYEERFDLEVETEEDTVSRSYRLTVLNVDSAASEIRVRLEIRTPAGEFGEDEFDTRVTTIRDSSETEQSSEMEVTNGTEQAFENDFAVGDSALTDDNDGASDFEEFPEGELADLIEAKFWVGPFDFPMIDNTRLSNDQRCAVVLKKFKYPIVALTVICFPGSHSSLKEKPYYGEIVRKLLPNRSKGK